MKSKFLRDLKEKNRAKRTYDIIEKALDDCERYVKRPLESVAWEDILSFIEYLKASGYSQSTIDLTKSKLKQFYLYCHDETDDIKYRKIAKKLSSKIEAIKKLDPQDILIESDITKMVNVCTLERDRCVIMVMWESGMRAGELLNLDKSMIEINHSNKEVIFHIPDKPGSKTGARSVLCKKVYFYVIDWMKCNPTDKFIDLKLKRLNLRLKTIAMTAGIKKPVNPHSFRHGAITHAVNQKMNEIDIKMRFWGNINSAMLEVYVHLSKQMMQDSYRAFIDGDSKTAEDPEGKVCIVCGRPVIHDDLCQQCQDYKDLKARMEALESIPGLIDSMQDMFEEHPGKYPALERIYLKNASK